MIELRVAHGGKLIKVSVSPSDPCGTILDAVASSPPLDHELCRIIARGKRLDLQRTLAEEGLTDGTKVKLIATQRSSVEVVQRSKPDPTVRPFSVDEARERARRVEGASVPRQHPTFKFCRFRTLSKFMTPHPFEADRLLQKLATDPGVVHCMETHRWTVGELQEMDPRDDRLAASLKEKDGGCLLGYNENAGARIYVRLRTDDLKGFLPYDQLINTLLHEMTHNAVGPHNAAFWRLFSELKASYLRVHKRRRVGQPGAVDVEREVQAELARDANNGALDSSERAGAAQVAAERAIVERLREAADAAARAVPRPARSEERRGDVRARLAERAEARRAASSGNEMAEKDAPAPPQSLSDLPPTAAPVLGTAMPPSPPSPAMIATTSSPPAVTGAVYAEGSRERGLQRTVAALRLSESSDAERKAAAATVVALLKNATRDDDAKFRRINLSNKRVARARAAFPFGTFERLFAEAGWRRAADGTESLELARVDHGLLWLTREMVEERLSAMDDS